ncbi:MAG: 5-dehydro-4-deoxyglucarate dehydratase [Acidimicrobiia bacterium]|nr:5-dehydro-4-deoxyglucarate dehydratase [Acidimicrobiia bacterium]
MNKELAIKLRGVFGFPVTSFKKDLSLDLDAQRRNVDEMTKHPFCAIVAAGGTGEMYSMTVEENIAVVKASVEATAGRMPVVGGVGYNTSMGIEMARGMEKAGAAALLVMPPYYTNAPTEGLYAYYEAIGKATALPLSLYSRDWAVFTPEMVARLCERVPTLTFWKDGQGDARKYQRIMGAVGDRLAWIGGIGDDCVPAYFAVGVQAYTSSISTIAPKLSLALADAGLKRDFAKLDDLMKKFVHPLYAFRDKAKGYEVSVMKAAMEILGKPAGPVRPPLVPIKPDEEQAVRKLLDGWSAWL